MCPLPNHYCPLHIEHEAEYLASRERWRNKERSKAHWISKGDKKDTVN